MNGFKLTLEKGAILLNGLLKNGVALEYECGGTLACGTCRVVVREGFENLAPASEDEQDMLERAGATGPGARLACQATGRGGDILVELAHTETSGTGPARRGGPPITLTERAAKHLAAQLAKRPGAAPWIATRPARLRRRRSSHFARLGAIPAARSGRCSTGSPTLAAMPASSGWTSRTKPRSWATSTWRISPRSRCFGEQAVIARLIAAFMQDEPVRAAVPDAVAALPRLLRM